MAYSNKEGALLVESVLSADGTLDVESRGCSSGSFELVWKDAAATDAVVKLQENLGGTTGTWFDISSQTVTIGAATGSKLFKLDSIVTPWIRVLLDANSETAAKLTLRYYLKGDR